MSDLRFRVDDVVDDPDHAGVLARGRIILGRLDGLHTLTDQMTGRPVRLLAVEVLSSTARRDGEVALVVDRDDSAYARPGRIWEG